MERNNMDDNKNKNNTRTEFADEVVTDMDKTNKMDKMNKNNSNKR